MTGVPYYSDWRGATHSCSGCDWQGTGSEADQELFTDLIQVDCPSCFGRLFLVVFPTAEDTRLAAAAGNDEAQRELARLARQESYQGKVEASRLRSAEDLPDLDGDQLDFYLELLKEEHGTVLILVTGTPDNRVETVDDPRVIHTEYCYYEDTEPVARLVGILEDRYGSRFRYLRTAPAALYLEGDSLSAYREVDKALGAHKAPN